MGQLEHFFNFDLDLTSQTPSAQGLVFMNVGWHDIIIVGFGVALNLAKELVKFPQECLRADRSSAIHSTYSGKTIEYDLQHESENAAHVLTTEAVAGAKKFMSGLGRSGKFNVSHISEPEVLIYNSIYINIHIF